MLTQITIQTIVMLYTWWLLNSEGDIVRMPYMRAHAWELLWLLLVLFFPIKQSAVSFIGRSIIAIAGCLRSQFENE